MYEKLESCPSCGHTKFNNKSIIQDFSISNESFALSECDRCKLLFVNPRPSEDSLPKYYESEEYISHHNKANSLVNWLYKIVRNYTLKSKINLINRYQGTGTLLDFGAGTGHFLSAAKANGWNTVGIEPDENARKVASEQSKSEVHEKLESITKDQEFDVITAWHVIEHVYHLKDTLKSLRNKLSKKGTMFVALPNYKSFDSTHYGEYWAGYDVPRHLYHFDKNTFSDVAKRNKLEVIDIIPMKFDSYYVSLLSEKYKRQKVNFLKAFFVGMKSNRLAGRSGEYSSLIYVLKK